MLTHQRPPKWTTPFIQASKRSLVATWLEDPFWYWTHFFVANGKSHVVPCISRVRECRPCLEAQELGRGGRKLHAGAAAIVNFTRSVSKPVEKTIQELVRQFRKLPLDERRRYGYQGDGQSWIHPSEAPAARKHAAEAGTLLHSPEPVIEEKATAAIVELLAPVADEVQASIGADMQWRGAKTLLVPARTEKGLVTRVQVLEASMELPATFDGIVAFLDQHWRKFGISAMDAR